MADISIVVGEWAFGFKWSLYQDDGDTIIYRLVNVNTGWTGSGNYAILYVRSSQTWYDEGFSDPKSLSNSNDPLTGSSSVVNPEELYGFTSAGVVKFQITNPYYEPPPDNDEGNIVTNDFVEASLTYDNSTNKLTWILPASYASTTDFFVTAHRTDYVLQNLSAYVVTDAYLIHTQGTATFGTSNSSILAGTWVIKRIISAPNGSTGVKAQVIVTQTDVDAYNAPPADSGINAPPNTPRSRRGNLNFW